MDVARIASFRNVVLGGVAIAILAVFVYLVAGLFDGEDSTASPFEPIADAAERTSGYQGARVAVTGRIDLSELPAPVNYEGQGVFNGHTQRGRMTLSSDGPGESFPLTSVSEGASVYIRSPIFAAALPPGKAWMKVDAGSEALLQARSLGQADPSRQLDVLRAVGEDAEDLGPATVRGVPTTHYRATVDLAVQAQQLRDQGLAEAADQVERTAELSGGGIPVEVWIDDLGRVRRIVQTIPLSEAAGDAEMTMSMELYDFGIEPEVVIPPPGDVHDLTGLA
jgi:hypothetical protein